MGRENAFCKNIVNNMAKHFGIQLQQYADDTQPGLLIFKYQAGQKVPHYVGRPYAVM